MNQKPDIKSQVLKSIAWLGGMKYVGQGISWIITLIVIRVLDPSDYGLMAMASVSINLMLMVSELGLSAAIIQQENITKEELSKVFGFVIISHLILFTALFGCAPLISIFFSEPRLNNIIRAMSSAFILLSLYIMPQSLVLKNLNFRLKALIDFVSTFLSSFCILLLAIKGFGVWSLVLGSIISHNINMCGYAIASPFLIKPSFKIRGVENFVRFGIYTLGSRMLWFFYSNADIIIGGRMLGRQSIGTYSVANELASIPLDKFMPIINQVAFPAYSSIQASPELVRKHFLKALRIISIALFPAFWGLLVVAPELLGWLLGDKWIGAILPVQLLCVIMPFKAIGTLFAPMLSGIGRPDIHFRYAICAFIIMPIAFYVGAKSGVLGICLAWIFGYSIIFLISTIISIRAIQLSMKIFLSNIILGPIASALMIISLYCVKKLLANSIAPAVISFLLIGSGLCLYICLLYCLKKNSLFEIWGLVKKNESRNVG